MRETCDSAIFVTSLSVHHSFTQIKEEVVLWRRYREIKFILECIFKFLNQTLIVKFIIFFVFFSTILQNFFLCPDRCHGDVPPHFAQPCYVALGVVS